MMDIRKEITALEKKGVFIYLSYDHYKSGTNCNFSIEFTRLKRHNNQTSWFGDNHEFGNTADVLESAIKVAKWFLKGDRAERYFNNHHGDIGDEFRNMLINEFPTYADFAKSIDDYLQQTKA